MSDSVLDKIIIVILWMCSPAIILMILFVILSPVILATAFYDDYKAVKIELIKADWDCTRWERHLVGKVMTSQCVQYEKKE